MSADLLLEIGCEEIPSRYLTSALKQLRESTSHLLKDNRISYGAVKSWATPRRLVLLAEGLANRQEDLTKKVKGPPVSRAFDEYGEPTKAALGFAKSAGLEVDELEKEVLNGAEYLMAVTETKGKPVMELLPSLMYQAVSSVRFPRSMYWQKKGTRFARPVRWMLCLYGNKEVNFDFAGVLAGRNTYGHRFLSRGSVEVTDPGHYFKALEDNYVILDQRKRKEDILGLLQEKAAEIDGKPLISGDLLEEVCYLVEYPTVIPGTFDGEFLEIPGEVLITTMQVHQRFFPVVSASSGELMPHFLGISNNRYSDYTRRGYEKVLRARLADAKFFFREDTKTKLEENVAKLKKVVFQESLGTVYDKTKRVKYLAEYLAEQWGVSGEVTKRAARAAYLCKADLVTSMVREFPELQGVMGREYGIISGEDKIIAKALYEHYLPRSAGDDLPAGVEGTLVSLSDKLDTLAGCFSAGIQPTGSQDPYALRRQALGVVTILMEKDISVSLPDIIAEAIFLVSKDSQGKEPVTDVEGIKENMEEFIKQRIRYLLQEEKKLPYDVVDAVLAVPYGIVSHLYRRALLISNSFDEDFFKNIVSSYTRVNNLARKAPENGQVKASLLAEPAEKKLWEKVKITEKELEKVWAESDYEKALIILGGLREYIDNFFDDILVMAKEDALRQNRLNLLMHIKRLFNRFAEFSLIQMQ